MPTRKRKKHQPPQHPVQRVVMTINFNYVKTDLYDVIEEVIDSGQFPREIAVIDVLVYRQHQAQNRPKTTSMIQGGTNA